VTTSDGKIYTKQEDHAKGRAERPLSDAELIDKFSANAQQAISADKLDNIIDKTLNIQEFANITDFMSILNKNL